MDTNTSNSAYLRPTYSADSTGTRPEKLFFKLGRRYSEVGFHNNFGNRMDEPWLVTCYHAQFADELGQSNLIFEDISDTHIEPPTALPAYVADNLRMMEIIASLHRQWWVHEDLRADGAYRMELDDVKGFVLRQVTGQFSEFVDFLGDRLSEKRRKNYERILAALPLKTWQHRLSKHHAVTLSHGDTHWWNFALPKAGGDALKLLDWAVWHVDTPGYDLSYMLAVRGFPEHRAAVEQKLLRHYLAHLNVSGYTWDDLWQDYRMSAIYQTIWPIFWYRFVSPGIWWSALECSMAAFDELRCEEFL